MITGYLISVKQPQNKLVLLNQSILNSRIILCKVSLRAIVLNPPMCLCIIHTGWTIRGNCHFVFTALLENVGGDSEVQNQITSTHSLH